MYLLLTHSWQIVVYSLFAITILLIVGGVILLLLCLRVKDETKENAELVTKFFKDGYEYKNAYEDTYTANDLYAIDTVEEFGCLVSFYRPPA